MAISPNIKAVSILGVNVRPPSRAQKWQGKRARLKHSVSSDFYLPDHLTDLVSPLPLLSVLQRQQQQFGSVRMSSTMTFRHPWLVARELLQFDLLTDGRLELGLGAGSIRSEYDKLVCLLTEEL